MNHADSSSPLPESTHRSPGRSKRWTIGRRVSAGFAVVLLISAVLGAFSLFKMGRLDRQFRSVADDTLPRLEMISSIQTMATQTRLIVFKHISSGDAGDMARLDEQIVQNTKRISELFEKYESLAVTEGDKKVIADIKAEREAYLSMIGRVLERSRANSDNQGTYNFARTELDPIAQRYAAALTAASAHERETADTAAQVFRAEVSATRSGLAAGLACALLLGVAIGFGIIRSTSRVLRSVSDSLEDAAEQVASSSRQVSAASQTLAEGSSEQAASLEETSSSLEQMSSMTKRNSESATKANELARQARQSADNGANDMTAMKAAMGEIKASSEDIAKIIKTIDEIAFQTNILALNAAVEAARAGAAGAGFAVVADEVRALAQRSAQAARETAEKIDGARNKSALGFQISEKVAGGLADIVEKVRQVDQLIAEVSTASQEQSQGVVQISTAVGQMDKVVQSSASNAEETAAAAEQLSAQAGAMRQGVEALLSLVGGGAHGGVVAEVRDGPPPAVRSLPRPQILKRAAAGKAAPRSEHAAEAADEAQTLTFKDI